jgi:acyl carrier protein
MKNFLDLLTEDVFEETERGEINKDTIFVDLDEWDSLTALSLIAMIDHEYDVKITGDEINSAKTLEDIFDVIQTKKA